MLEPDRQPEVDALNNKITGCSRQVNPRVWTNTYDTHKNYAPEKFTGGKMPGEHKPFT